MLVCGKSFSQTDTKNKVVIDTAIAKKIAIDLLKGDECKQELKIVYKNTDLLNEKIIVKDSIIQNQKKQIDNFNKIILDKDKLLKISDENLSNTKKQLFSNQKNVLFYKITSIVSLTLLTIQIVK
jgi:hypothetical protein